MDVLYVWLVHHDSYKCDTTSLKAYVRFSFIRGNYKGHLQGLQHFVFYL